MPLILSVMAAALLATLGSMLVLGSVEETAIAASFRDGMQALHAADAAADAVAASLPTNGAWDPIAPSEFTDGPPSGVRTFGSVDIDLTQETQDVNAVARQRSIWSCPPVYQLHAYGRLANLTGTSAPDSYVAVWVATLEEERDETNPTLPVIGLIGRAYGATGGRRTVAFAVTPALDEDGEVRGMRTLWWHELR